ncbi:hypothetical protein [Falsiroseomonas sp. E2-1-a20]|uniref:hypothetical protein n=1 Tax=Falsiroseomonas sp. E2-1-a20 TaxID=3239300 RepID=UPI003F2BA0B8
MTAPNAGLRLYAALMARAGNPNGAFAPTGRMITLTRAPFAREGATMIDVLLPALGLGGFALMGLYARACARV